MKEVKEREREFNSTRGDIDNLEGKRKIDLQKETWKWVCVRERFVGAKLQHVPTLPSCNRQSIPPLLSLTLCLACRR